MSRLDYSLVVALIVLCFSLRVLHYPDILNFSTDQATFAARALEIWRNKELTLVGPTASFNVHGRYLIQSSVIYYTTLLFMVAANFEPVQASLLFVVSAAALAPLLYVGMKNLTSRRLAVLTALIYTCAPLYIRHSQFLWNPNYQLALVPVLIFVCGQYAQARKQRRTAARWWAVAIGLMAGWMTLYHYQMVPILVVGMLYVLVKRPSNWQRMVVGFLCGMSPLLAFEIHSGGYLLQTTWLLLSQMGSGSGTGARIFTTMPGHYYTTLSLLALVATLVAWQHTIRRLLSVQLLLSLAMGLLVIAVSTVARKPEHAYGMAPAWNFPLEERAYLQIATIVRERNLQTYAVANTLYDTLAPVTYFLLARDGVGGSTRDYRANDYLFVISAADGSSLTDNPAYEIAEFSPIGSVEEWELSPKYALFLLERE